MSQRPMSQPYHHGDLPNVLRAAAADVIAEKGVSGFSLREVARRAGVSHSAPAHHFRDTTGLLTSLAVEGMQLLYESTEKAAAGQTDPVERLSATGRAYVRFAMEHPAHAQIAFRADIVDADDPAYIESGTRAYGSLANVIRAVADGLNPELDIDLAARLCWSTMQGLVVLYDKMCSFDEHNGRATGDIDEIVSDFTRMLVDGLRGSVGAAAVGEGSS